MDKREFAPEEIAKSLRVCAERNCCQECIQYGDALVHCVDALKREAADLIEAQAKRIGELEAELAKLREENRWILTSERLPDRNEPVLVFCENITIQGGRTVHIGCCNKTAENCFWFLRTQPGVSSFPNHEWKVTHWKHMPQGPEVQYG